MSLTSLVRHFLRATSSTPVYSAYSPKHALKLQERRRFGISSYSTKGNSQLEDSKNSTTQDMKHPESLPPSTENEPSSQQPRSSFSASPPGDEVEDDIPRIPSNKARPTITDGRQSARVDIDGNVKPDVPEDVRQHNEEVSRRYDKPYNQIKDEGKVHKGFWKGV